eukprot:scaffold57403_cov17-Tisochrysis_lutea.AAC.3
MKICCSLMPLSLLPKYGCSMICITAAHFAGHKGLKGSTGHRYDPRLRIGQGPNLITYKLAGILEHKEFVLHGWLLTA